MNNVGSSLQVIAYLRVSTKEQGLNGIGLQAQRGAISVAANLLGAQILATYEDVASGMKSNSFARRKGLQNAMDHAEATGASLLVYNLDRLTRHAASLNEIIRRGIPFMSVADQIGTPPAVSFAAIAARKQLEGELIGARTAAGLQRRREQGVRLGNPTNLLEAGKKGNTANKDRSDKKAEEIAQVLRNNPGHQKMTKGQIADLLNWAGVMSPMGLKWNSGTVRRALSKALHLLPKVSLEIASEVYIDNKDFGRF